MAVLSFLEIPALKALAADCGYVLHLHDACGGQSFSLEAGENPRACVWDEIKRFFAQRGMQVEFSGADRLRFGVR